MRLLVLYSRMADYFYQGLCRAVHEHGLEVLVVCQRPAESTPFQFEEIPGLRLVYRDAYDAYSLQQLYESYQPERVYAAGWSDEAYRGLMRRARRAGVKVLMGMDNLWTGSARQRVGSWLGHWYLPQLADICWVPGLPQFAYALRLGFSPERIRTGLYCAHGAPFEAAALQRDVPMPRVLLFVGRLVAYKNPVSLARQFAEAREAAGSDWQLWMAGDGPLMGELKALQRQHSGAIKLLGFTPPQALPSLFAQAGAFCLPSHREHWGVVVHEAACAGLPILSTTSCGASSAFLFHGFNGWKFDSQRPEELQRALEALLQLDGDQLRLYGERSLVLSRAFSPEQFAAVLTEPLQASGH
jgi:glycosyltransferase involved in cell wall biosynthesis